MAQSWSVRSKQPGVIRAIDFADAAWVDAHVAPIWGTNPPYKAAHADTVVRCGETPSLRFDIAAKSGQDTGGAFWVNFSDDLSQQIGPGQEVFIQFRQRMSSTFVPLEKVKQAIIGAGDQPGKPAFGSCTSIDVVMNKSAYFWGPILYHNCGLYEQIMTRPRLQDVGSCDYGGNLGGCLQYRANQWMTFQVRIKVGTFSPNPATARKDSLIEMWMGYEGGAQRKILSQMWALKDLDTAVTGPTQFGKLWLLPYQTGRDYNIAYPPAHTWYGQVIISRQVIDDPVDAVTGGGSTGGRTARRRIEPPSPTNEEGWTKLGGLSSVIPADRLAAGGRIGAPTGIAEGWSGGCALDDAFYDAIGGGHRSCGGNDTYRFRGGQWTCALVGSLASIIPTAGDPSMPIARTYPDGKPCAAHTYSGRVGVPSIKRILQIGGAVYHCSGTAPDWCWLIDPANPADPYEHVGSAPNGGRGHVAAYDPAGDQVVAWFDPAIATWNPRTRAWTVRNGVPKPSGNYSGAIAPAARKMLVVGGGAARVLDLVTWKLAPLIFTGPHRGIAQTNAPGLDWHEELKAFVLWTGGATLYLIDPARWAITARYLPGPVPPEAQPNGTFGRMRVLSNGQVVVVPSIYEMYVATIAGATPSPA